LNTGGLWATRRSIVGFLNSKLESVGRRSKNWFLRARGRGGGGLKDCKNFEKGVYNKEMREVGDCCSSGGGGGGNKVSLFIRERRGEWAPSFSNWGLGKKVLVAYCHKLKIRGWRQPFQVGFRDLKGEPNSWRVRGRPRNGFGESGGQWSFCGENTEGLKDQDLVGKLFMGIWDSKVDGDYRE